MAAHLETDILIVGAGFYGCSIAVALRRLGAGRVTVVDEAADIMTRASFVNQARIHNGYHYPRSLVTAQSCRRSYERFRRDYAFAAEASFTSCYAIARNSRVSPGQFESFCREIGAFLAPLPASLANLFDPQLILAAYRADEMVFNATQMAAKLRQEIAETGVDLRLGTKAYFTGDDGARAHFRLSSGDEGRCQFIVNATYAGLDSFGVTLGTRIKKELAEVVLIDLPPELKSIGVTVMDGPFFSVTPFPPLQCHALTHVRYTPVCAWDGAMPAGLPPAGHHPGLNADAILRDSLRYMPSLARAKVRSSLLDVKTILLRNEDDDGRPILFERAPESPRVLSVLGSKFDTVYDAIEALCQVLDLPSSPAL
jgi:glycine/D-amino acid oxidase-like deaminating enzyme